MKTPDDVFAILINDHGWEAAHQDRDPDKDFIGASHEDYPGLVLNADEFDSGDFTSTILYLIEEAYAAGYRAAHKEANPA